MNSTNQTIFTVRLKADLVKPTVLSGTTMFLFCLPPVFSTALAKFVVALAQTRLGDAITSVTLVSAATLLVVGLSPLVGILFGGFVGGLIAKDVHTGAEAGMTAAIAVGILVGLGVVIFGNAFGFPDVNNVTPFILFGIPPAGAIGATGGALGGYVGRAQS